MKLSYFQDYHKRVVENCSRVIVGKEDVISLVLTCFVCSGHVLLEDIPGTGKTMLLRAFAKTVGSDFKRIQFTPDLVPSDLTGINFYNQKTGEFEFRSGPLFSNMILADEINRATPRTQSSLVRSSGGASDYCGWHDEKAGGAIFCYGYPESIGILRNISSAGCSG